MHSNPSPRKRADTDLRLTRRELLQTSARLLGAGCLCQCLSAASEPLCCSTPDLEPASLSIGDEVIRIDLAKAASLAPIPSAAYIVAPEKGIQILLVRRSKREFVAVSRLCTHGNQTISYIPKRGLLQCNNFNHSIFDLNGQVVKGPAESPLRVYPVKRIGEVLRIRIREEARA